MVKIKFGHLEDHEKEKVDAMIRLQNERNCDIRISKEQNEETLKTVIAVVILLNVSIQKELIQGRRKNFGLLPP